MKYRIKAAWKVLRGDWIAQPSIQFPSVWTISGRDQYGNQMGSNATDVKLSWTTPPIDAKKLGRNAVRRHRGALSLLGR